MMKPGSTLKIPGASTCGNFQWMVVYHKSNLLQVELFINNNHIIEKKQGKKCFLLAAKLVCITIRQHCVFFEQPFICKIKTDFSHQDTKKTFSL